MKLLTDYEQAISSGCEHRISKTTGVTSILARLIADYNDWSPALRETVETALAARAKDIAPHVFCTRKGESYVKEDGSANAWDSLWQRFMRKVLKEAKVEEHFTEHDLRAKCASDAESHERARELLAHADSQTTRRIYRRRPERVRPAK